MRAVVLAGGTGGAKLAAGMQEIIGPDLSVVVNTGDDVELLGVHVSPDPDLVTYWLSGEIDAKRGWGIRDDSFTVFERLEKLGAPSWFGLSDRDLATCLRRRELLDQGVRQTDAQRGISRALGVRSHVLPMSDEPVRTRLRTAEGWLGIQDYLVREHAEPEVLEIDFEGVEQAAPSPEVADAIGAADAIVIGPSNPVISIGPILAVPGLRGALAAAAAPVVAVSPYVGGKIIKGPTSELLRASGREPSTLGVIAAYEGVADAYVVDPGDTESPPDVLQTLTIGTLMDTDERRREVAERVLEYARSLA